MPISGLTSKLGAIYEDPLANWHSLSTNWAVQKLASVTGISGLPAHFHEILLSTVFYFGIHFATILFAPIFVPQYRRLNGFKKHGFDAHVVSHVNSILLCALSLPLFFSPVLDNAVAYTPYAGFVVASAIGYFVWDVCITLYYYKYNGFGFFLHAITALYVFLQALRPFMLNSAAVFLWFEASTPFVNINWFGTHIPGLISPTIRNINSLALLVVFFLCRIVSGPLNGYRYFKPVFTDPPTSVPTLDVYGVVASYLVMISLNFFWFYKMLRILFKMILAKHEDKKYDLSDKAAEKTSSAIRQDAAVRRRR